MKKVLALVLAVIMVCTMAMAVTVGGTNIATPDDANINASYRPITPGKSIIFDRADLGLDTTFAANKDGTFAPEKNKVEVTFAKGADLIASQGWVKTTDATDPYRYVITTKADDSAVLNDSADIIISKVAVTKYGIAGTTTYYLMDEDANGNNIYAYTVNGSLTDKLSEVAKYENPAKYDMDLITAKLSETGCTFYMVFNYGRVSDDFVIGTTTPDTATADVLYTVKKAGVGADASKNYAAVDGGVKAAYSLKAGEKVIFGTVPNFNLTTSLTKSLQSEIITNDVTVTPVLGGAVVPNKAVKITVNNQKEGAALYMVNTDGTLTNLGAKFDDNGVLTATAKITGAVILADKALTATNVTTGTTTTTNPGTGANDVVGVAAALAVVALVSGAAISLKK
ncbi:MAG TPA: hypothetical protein DCP22_06765 [Ruminococcaceae bacterium]|nr:hypothetical protein [Oscillospiraceae bacterium]